MIRSALVLLVSLLCLSSVQASLERKERSSMEKFVSTKTVPSLPIASTSDEYRITDATEVLLDGRPCRYEQVPSTAVIILLETVSNESKQIARIHFRTARRPASPATSK